MSDSFVTPRAVARHAPLSMGFPRQEYWSGLLFPSLGDLPDPGIELMFPALAGGFFMAEPVNSKRLHFQTPSHWELGFSVRILGGYTIWSIGTKKTTSLLRAEIVYETSKGVALSPDAC